MRITTLEQMIQSIRASFEEQRAELKEREDEMIRRAFEAQINSGILRNEIS